MMKIVENKILPFGSFSAMVLGKFIFTKDASNETIHYYQQAELSYIGFFVMYFLSYVCQLIRCALYKNIGLAECGSRSVWKRAYRTVLFEREAYEHEDDPEYLEKRAPYAWFILNFYL